jgi:hypothetical protein
MEPVRATITTGQLGPLRVTVLDHDGRRTGKTIVVSGSSFEIDGQRDQSPYYLVEGRNN